MTRGIIKHAEHRTRENEQYYSEQRERTEDFSTRRACAVGEHSAAGPAVLHSQASQARCCVSRQSSSHQWALCGVEKYHPTTFHRMSQSGARKCKHLTIAFAHRSQVTCTRADVLCNSLNTSVLLLPHTKPLDMIGHQAHAFIKKALFHRKGFVFVFRVTRVIDVAMYWRNIRSSELGMTGEN